MLPSSVRKKIAQGEPVICAKASYHHPEITELVGRFGFDGIWICLEHKRTDPANIYSVIQACRLAGIDAIMRVKPANYADLLWLLEAGARGLMLPRVRNAQEVMDVVAAMKFPPLGHRGLDGVSVDAGFGRMPAAEYMADANREAFLIAQIEEPEVVPHIDAIAAIPGVDILFVGPGDLTLSLGKLMQLDDPQIVAVLTEVVAACRRHGKVAGIPCRPAQVKSYHEMGFRFFNVTSDYRCLSDSLKKTCADLAALGIDGLHMAEARG